MKYISNTVGSAMMDVLVSFFVLTLGFTGALTVVNSARNVNIEHNNRFTGIHLAQEAIEAIHNMRDTNWMVYSSQLRECWHFWDNTNDDDAIDGSDVGCAANPDGLDPTPNENGQNFHPWENDVYIIDLDSTNFRWFLKREDDDENTSDDKLYQTPAGLYTHVIGANTETIFSRTVEMEYLDQTGDKSANPFPDEASETTVFLAKKNDNRILVTVTVSWLHQGHARQVSLSTVLTDYYQRTEWNS